MECINEKNLLRLLRSDKYDYLGFAITPWHAHSLNAGVDKLNSVSNKDLKGIVIILPNPQSGYLINSTNIKANAEVYFYNASVSKISKLFQICRSILYYRFFIKKSNHESFYFLNPNEFRYTLISEVNHVLKRKRKMVIVELDEGIGTYINSRKDWFSFDFQNAKGVKDKISAVYHFLYSRIANKELFCKIDAYINCCLLKQEGVKCTINQEIITHYRKSFISRNKPTQAVSSKKYVLINTQPFDMIEGKESLMTIYSICIQLCKELGYDVFLKIHPRENISDYSALDVNILPVTEMSQEEWIANASSLPTYIISFFSTTLITCNILFDIKAISIIDILNSYAPLIISRSGYNGSFKEKFSDFVKFAASFDDLKKMINPRGIDNEIK